jgi:hypothetical protein
MTDAKRFENLAVLCLQEFVPSLRPTGGSGDRQRDAVAGPILAPQEDLALTASLSQKWARKISEDIAGLVASPSSPATVIAATNRSTSPKTRRRLVQTAKEENGIHLFIADLQFLALRLLHPDLLHVREEFLRLPQPSPPVALEADAFRNLMSDKHGAMPLRGRDAVLGSLLGLLKNAGPVALVGPGGLGKTRLALGAADELPGVRVLFLDDRAPLSSARLPAELAGTDDLLLVVDNAHRRADLSELVGLLQRRSGITKLLLIARDGFLNVLEDAVDGSPLGPLTRNRVVRLTPLSNASVAELVRDAKPTLEYEGAIREIVMLADGNPLLALLAHGVATDGQNLHDFGQSDVLGVYASSVLRSLAQGVTDVSGRELIDLLTTVAALGMFNLADDAALSAMSALTGIDGVTMRRVLLDVADAGLLVQQAEGFTITPDLLSGHLLWVGFFAPDSIASFSYAAVWNAFAFDARPALCVALGGVRGSAIDEHHPSVQPVVEALVSLARADSAQALKLTQSLAPGLPWLAELVVDVALDHLPSDPPRRAAALLAAAEALQRTPVFTEGWPRQLRVAAELCAVPGSPEQIKTITEHLTSVYSRVPVSQGPHAGQILAGVQHGLTTITADYWARSRHNPGTAHAVALATRQLLTVSISGSWMSIEDENVIRLGGWSLPATEHTERVLSEGARLFVDTLPELDPQVQNDQVGQLETLRLALLGHGAGLANVQPDLANIVGKTIYEIRNALASTASAIPLWIRGALEDTLGPIWPDDPTLSEFQLLFATGFDESRDVYDEDARRPRVTKLVDLLNNDPDPSSRVQTWQAWACGAMAAGVQVPGAVVQDVLLAAAQTDAASVSAWLDDLYRDDGVLLNATQDALAYVFDHGPGGDARAERMASSAIPTVRACGARALSRSVLSTRLDRLRSLACDADVSVRHAVVDSIRFGTALTAEELDIALLACPPDGVRRLSILLFHRATRLRHLHSPAALTPTQVSAARDIVINAAARERADGREIKHIIERLPASERLAVEYSFARIAWLDSREANTKTLSATFGPDSVPDEISEIVAGASTDADRVALLDQIENEAEHNSAYSARRDLLGWIDQGSAVITERLIRWLASGEDDLRYEADQILDHTISDDAFTKRAKRLLAADLPLEIEDQILRARRPTMWSGSRRPYWKRLRDFFHTWTEDNDRRIASLGRAGVSMYETLISKEDLNEQDDVID